MTDRKSRIRKVEQCSVVKHGKPLAKIEPGP